MAVIRVNHNTNYTVMSNYHLRDTSLSLKAKGLLSQMLSLPPDWDYTVAGLVSINQEKETAITAALKELKKHGYLIVTKRLPNQTESGRYEYIYDIYENPKQGVEKQGIEKQGVEFLGVEIQGLENQGQLNKDELNKDKRNKDNTKFVPPTVEEVAAYCRERGNNINPEEFVAYYGSQKWKKSNGQPVSDWKLCVITWERDNKKKGNKNSNKKNFGYELDPEVVKRAYAKNQDWLKEEEQYIKEHGEAG